MNDLHSSAGSYAVDALSPAERDEFETHLAGCAGCRREVAQFAETLARLTPLSATAPPASLRTSVLAAVAGSRQAGSPVAARSDEQVRLVGDQGPEATPRRAKPAQVTELRPLDPEEVVPLEEHPSVVPVTPWLDVPAALSEDLGTGRPRRRERLLAALVTAAMMAVVVLSGWVYVMSERDRVQAAQAQQEVALLTAPDAKLYTDITDNGVKVSYVVSQDLDRALFIASGLTSPRAGKTYQVWVLRGEEATPADLVTEGGDIRQLITKPVEDATKLALSVEPAGGSRSPTDVIADVELSP